MHTSAWRLLLVVGLANALAQVACYDRRPRPPITRASDTADATPATEFATCADGCACGDGRCDAPAESWQSCPVDCWDHCAVGQTRCGVDDGIETCVVADGWDWSPCLDGTRCSEDADAIDDGVTAECICPPGGCTPDDVPPVVEEQPVGCTSRQCFEDFGPDSICAGDGSCVDTLTTRCVDIPGPLDLNSIFPVGSIAPYLELSVEESRSMERAVRLAFAEVNTRGGLPGGRRMVLLACDSRAAPNEGRRAARHMVNVLGVRAVVGPAYPNVFNRAWESVAQNAPVLFVSPDYSTPSAIVSDDRGLAWQFSNGSTPIGAYIADRVIAQRQEAAPERGPIVVLTASTNDHARRELRKTLDDAGLLDDVIEHTYPTGTINPEEALVAPLRDAHAEAPDPDAIVVLGGTPNTLTALYRLIGTTWSPRGDLPRVYTGSTSPQTAAASLQMPGGWAWMIPHVDGVGVDVIPSESTPAPRRSFAQRFSAAWGRSPTGEWARPAYDAAWVLAYAATLTARDGLPIDGRTLSDQLTRFQSPDAPLVQVGPDAWPDRALELVRGEQINLVGLNSALHLNQRFQRPVGEPTRWRLEWTDEGQLTVVYD